MNARIRSIGKMFITMLIIIVLSVTVLGSLAGCGLGKKDEQSSQQEVTGDSGSQKEESNKGAESSSSKSDSKTENSKGDSSKNESSKKEDSKNDSSKKDENSKNDNSKPNTPETSEPENSTPAPVQKYTVTFNTNGGSGVKSLDVEKGENINDLYNAYKEGHVFLGWYYDEELSQPVASTDVVTEDLSLYAGYLEEAPLESLETVNFASAMDVDTDFSIIVISADSAMSADTVKSAILAEDLTDPGKTDIVRVTGSNGQYIIQGVNGFDPGSTYRITLNDIRLTFKDQPDTVREYNFTTHQEEVLNLGLQGGIIYIPAEDLKNIINDGQTVSTLSIAMYEVDEDGTISAADMSEGSFEYDGQLHVGDIVSIYEGLIPTERTLDTPKEQLGDLAYLEITAVSGNTYSYVNAQPEDVIFEPDVLPIPGGVDLDNNTATITVEDKYLDFSADIFAAMEMDSQTTVDIGDFIAFYTGELGVSSGDNAGALTGVYGKITGVQANGDGTTTVTYITVGWEDVESCMDIYSQEEVTAAELLEGVDIDAMESEIEQQAIDSGFAEEAAQYLASLALATENFTTLSENMNLEDYKITLVDGTPISPEELQLMAGNIQVEAEMADGYPKATVGIRPKHLGNISGTNADKQGLVITLEVQVVVTISKSGSDNQLELTITGEFVEELGLEVGAKSKTEWSFAGGFIPYISAYKLNANLDLVNYTGVSFNATMVTKEKDDDGEDDDDDEEEEIDIAEEIKGLLEGLTDGAEDEEEAEENENILIQRYSEMIKAESDWIRVVECNLVEVDQGVPPMLPIIRLGYAIDFVVQLDASVSVGFDFEYLEGKRYIFNVNITEGSVSSDTVTLQEQTYQFTFYAMGRLGIKAGVEMDFTVALFHKSFANVGFEAGAGPYAKLWGYFFYELKYSESAGKSQKYSGALLIEVGVYFELNIKAEAIGGIFCTEKSLVDKEWPLWDVGARNNVLDFNTEQEDMPEIVLKQHVRSAMLEDGVFLMDYLDLVTGEGKNAIYGDWYNPELPADEKNRANFIITMTNDKFTYDPQTNTIKVNPEEGDKKLEGEMIITWIRQPLTFTSKPIQRTISLYWDNLRDGYVIVPVSNGGTYIPLINKKFEAPVTAPEDPQKQGYVFDGWYSDEELTVPYVFPELMPDVDAYIYAKWAPATDTPYTVEHYQEQFLSGEYELVETEVFTGTTDSYAAPAVKNYAGFNTPVAQEIKIQPDGSTVLRYYYSLQRHTVSFEYGEVGGDAVVYELKYGADVVAPVFFAKGYTFAGWSVDGVNTVDPITVVGTEDVVYTALWTKNPDTSYRVEYYVQQEDGRYTLQYMIENQAFTGTVLTEETLRQVIVDGTKTADEAYILENAIAAENMTVNGITCIEATVDGSGKTVIKINYKRVLHNVTFDLNYEGAQDIVKEMMYGAEIVAPQALVRTGYTFAGWSLDGVNEVTPAANVGTEDITYKALWTANEYTVQFHAAGGQGTMADMSFVYDEAQPLTANVFTRTGYTFEGWATKTDGGVKYVDKYIVFNLTDEPDGVVDLYAVWAPENYTIGYEGVDGAVHTNPASYTVESETILLADAVKIGYTFDGWYEDAGFAGNAVETIEKGSAGSITLYAKWIANTDTAYKAEHWQEQLDGSFVLVETDHYTGTTASAVTPAVKEYTGFAAPEAATVNVAADGSTVVRYDYTRRSYTITFDPNGGSLGEGVSNTLTALYGAEITLPVPTREGYGFSGWYAGEAAFDSVIMGAEDLTLTAQWAEGEYGYTVNHYKQNLDGETYSLAESVRSTGLMDHVVTLETKVYEGFTAPEQLQSITITVNVDENVVNYYYTRNQYDLTWAFAGGNVENQTYTQGKVYYGAQIAVPVPVMKGYSYNWDVAPAATMPPNDLSYTAVWSVNSYSVSFDYGNAAVVSGDVQTRSVVYGTAYGELA
ncbi:MAG: InlB B-repeat-containing protein, partial [Firmicutes bacterium]|nr:InlB B-repeat-containing protein [Bacillota bacterium]